MPEHAAIGDNLARFPAWKPALQAIEIRPDIGVRYR